MTQLFDENGRVVPVTVLEAEPAQVVLARNQEKDGYNAVQVSAYGKKKEFKTGDETVEKGTEYKVADFEPGEKVHLKGVSKGRGFAGVIKRHGFHGFPASHGHPHQRVPGSIGQAFPQHVRKGTRMAGRMGGQNVTLRDVVIMAVDPERNLLFVKGSVPGATGGFIAVSATGEKKEIPTINSFVTDTQTSKEQMPESKENQTSEQTNEESADVKKVEETSEETEGQDDTASEKPVNEQSADEQTAQTTGVEEEKKEIEEEKQVE